MHVQEFDACLTRHVAACGAWDSCTCDMTHSYMWHDKFICVTWLLHMCDMTHSLMCHDSFICETSLIRDSFMCLTHMCAMTHSYVRHDSFICVTPLIHTTRHDASARTTHYVRHDSCMCQERWCVTFLNSYNMTHSCTWHDAFICATWRVFVCAHSCVCHDSFVVYQDSFMRHDTWLTHVSYGVCDSCKNPFHVWIRFMYESDLCDCCKIHERETWLWLLQENQIRWFRFLQDSDWEVGCWGRVPFSRNLMSPTPRRKWYLTTGRRAH